MSRLSIVYLDLDRTLFRTERIGLIWEYLGKIYPGKLDVDKCTDEISLFKKIEKAGSHYDWSSHISSYGIDPQEAVIKLSQSEIADGRMEYEGVGSLIAKIESLGLTPKILTFGLPFVQTEFKIGLCPSLAGVEVITTLEHKSEYFDKHQEAGVMLDDRPIGDSLPLNIKFVQSAGYNTIPPLVNPGWPVVTSLAEFEDVLESMVNDDYEF